jgi:hypothetical protein
MNDKKLKQIFDAARRDMPPAVPEDFAHRVAGAISREGREAPVPFNLFDHLNRSFARYAIAAAATIVLCGALELSQRFSQEPSLDDDIEQIYTDWTMR